MAYVDLSNGVRALDGLSLEISEGEFVAIIGANGRQESCCACWPVADVTW